MAEIAAEAHSPAFRPNFWKLTLGSVGVVYGDIGTSPLYALREALDAASAGGLAEREIIGVVSLLIWTLILIVTLKYVVLILRADNRGEGGTLSLVALAQQAVGRTTLLFVLGVLGAGLFFGDAAITPAISVLSAVEGLKVVAPTLGPFVLPVTVAILVALFWVQGSGTGRMAGWFGPVTLVWFLTLAALGLLHVGDSPAILRSLNPGAAAGFILEHGIAGLPVMGAVFLAVTGSEALYADMGHFGRGPIRLAWTSLVFPALALNYLGQGALVLSDRAAVENPFFLLAPTWMLPPLVALATAATVIASQAVITGAFSLTHQAVQLGLLPRLEIRHTSESLVGQIYMPGVNWVLLAGVLVLVFAFGGSAALASAYGIAVSGTMVITSLLALVVFRRTWGWTLPAVVAVIAPLLAVELVFLGANLAKVADGGYAPMLLAAAISVAMWTWVRGTRLVQEKAQASSMSLTALMAMLEKSHPHRVPGVAVFLTAAPEAAPAALLHNLKHNHVLHERNLIVTVEVANTPRVRDEDRVRIEELSPGFKRVFVSFGYMEGPNVPRALALAKKQGVKFDIMSTSFFLNRRSFRASGQSAMPLWQDRLFISMTKVATDATSFYRLPSNRVLELGQQFVL